MCVRACVCVCVWHVLRRLIKGVKEQLRINREEEKQKLLEQKNISDDHRKMLKMAAAWRRIGAALCRVTSTRRRPLP